MICNVALQILYCWWLITAILNVQPATSSAVIRHSLLPISDFAMWIRIFAKVKIWEPMRYPRVVSFACVLLYSIVLVMHDGSESEDRCSTIARSRRVYEVLQLGNYKALLQNWQKSFAAKFSQCQQLVHVAGLLPGADRQRRGTGDCWTVLDGVWTQFWRRMDRSE